MAKSADSQIAVGNTGRKNRSIRADPVTHGVFDLCNSVQKEARVQRILMRSVAVRPLWNRLSIESNPKCRERSVISQDGCLNRVHIYFTRVKMRCTTDVLFRRSPSLSTRTDKDVRPTNCLISLRAKYKISTGISEANGESVVQPLLTADLADTIHDGFDQHSVAGDGLPLGPGHQQVRHD
jgi:hypothetical protein